MRDLWWRSPFTSATIRNHSNLCLEPMPRQSITDLRNAIESAPEMTAEHREEMLALVNSLENEVAGVGTEEDDERAEKLREAIVVAGDVVRKRTAGEEAEEEHDLSERLAELEQKVEMVAVEHPVIANVLAAIARIT